MILLCHDVFINIEGANKEKEGKTGSSSRGLENKRPGMGSRFDSVDGTRCSEQCQCSSRASGWS